MSNVAVYFPFGHPDEPLMKRALLTWDHLEVMAGSAPNYNAKFRPSYFQNMSSSRLLVV